MPTTTTTVTIRAASSHQLRRATAVYEQDDKSWLHARRSDSSHFLRCEGGGVLAKPDVVESLIAVVLDTAVDVKVVWFVSMVASVTMRVVVVVPFAAVDPAVVVVAVVVVKFANKDVSVAKDVVVASNSGVGGGVSESIDW